MLFVLGCVAAGIAAGKSLELVASWFYKVTTGKENDRKWAEFMVLYNRLKAEHIARMEAEEKGKE